MIDLTQVRAKGAVLPDELDKRVGIALSGGVVKEDFGNTKNIFKYEQNTSTTPLRINQEFFEKRIAEETLMLSKDPKNIKLLKRVGDVYLANKKAEKAKTYYNRAFLLDTDDLQTAGKLAGAFMVLGKPEKADQVLNMLTSKEDSGILHLHAVAKMARNDLDGSVAVLRKISSDAKNYYESVNTEGLIYLMRGEVKEAEECFNLSIESNAEYSPAKNNLAVCYTAQNQTSKAIRQYRKVIGDDPNYVVPFNNLFNILIEEKDINTAYELMLSAKHLADADNEIQFRTAWCEMQLGKFAEAIVSYGKVLDILPDNSNTLNNIGFCYEQLGEMERAISYFLMAIKGNNVTLFPYKNLMVSYDTIGDFAQSRKYASIVIANAPNDIHAMVLHGNGLVEAEKWEDAFKYLLKAYEEKPDIVSLYVSLAFIYADIFPDFEKGMEVVDLVLKRKMPKYAEIYNNYIHLLLVNDHDRDAEKYIDNLNPEHPVSSATLALYELKKGNLDKAKELYKKAEKLANNQFKKKIKQRMYFDLASYYLSVNDLDNAKGAYKSVVELGDKGFAYILAAAKVALLDL